MSLERSKSKLARVALISALAAVPLGAGVAGLSLPAAAQTAQSPTPPPPMQGQDWQRGGPGMRGPGMHGMGPDDRGHWGGRFGGMGYGHHHANRQMRLAEKLAAVETAIGVRSDQLDAWRDFTSKLIAFATPPWQQNRASGPNKAAGGNPPMKAGNARGDATLPDVPPAKDSGSKFGMLDRMIDGAIQRGDEARQLKDSLQKLESVLTPEQIQTARMLMRPERGMGWHGGRHGWHGDRHGWHGEHMWRGRHDGRGFGAYGGGWGGPGRFAPDQPGADDGGR